MTFPEITPALVDRSDCCMAEIRPHHRYRTDAYEEHAVHVSTTQVCAACTKPAVVVRVPPDTPQREPAKREHEPIRERFRRVVRLGVLDPVDELDLGGDAA